MVFAREGAKVAALEGAKSGIRVNCVCPGPIANTMLSDNICSIEGMRERMTEQLGRGLVHHRGNRPRGRGSGDLRRGIHSRGGSPSYCPSGFKKISPGFPGAA